MSLQEFMNDAISPWMRTKGPDSDIILSSRIRLARNLENARFPTIADESELKGIQSFFKEKYSQQSFQAYKNFEFILMEELTHVEKRVLVEKHLISPYLAKEAVAAGVLISQT